VTNTTVYIVSGFQVSKVFTSSHLPSPKMSISSSHRTVVTDPEIPRRNLIRSSGLSSRESKLSITGLQKSRSLVPNAVNISTHNLHPSDDSDLSRGFHHEKSRAFVIRILDSAIPDFPKWVISRHVAFVIRTV
jgi:hypothetical protein